ncbi:MAG: DUF3644 domain-containing protein [Adlercreutzia sp.]|nr:DUF3644 domain-containing protein [Adlercreutzia sp.]
MNEDDQKTYDRLISKAREAFVLAIEVYNRPSIRYRVEGFAFFICNAWELMLKAKMLRDDGRGSIYYKDNPNRTITLERCVAHVFTNKKGPLRRNLEDVIALRNTSTHFIVEEHEQIYVGLFQACLNNFDDKMFEFHGVNMGDVVPPHFLTLSMTADPATPERIRAKYPPEVAEKFLFEEAQIIQERDLLESLAYSTVMVTELAWVKDPEKADFKVAPDSASDKPIRTAKVFRDPSTTHPLTASAVIKAVNKKLRKKSIVLKVGGEKKNFTTAHWALFMKFYGFKDNKDFGYCHDLGNTQNYTYSMHTVDFIVQTIGENPDDVINSLKTALKKKEAR